MSKRNIIIAAAVTAFIAALLAVALFFNPERVDVVIKFTESHPLIGPFALIFWRVLGIVVPAIPAGVVSFAVVPIFGWFLTYIYTLIGILVGTTIAFWLARKFREPLVKRFMPLQKIHELEDEMSARKEFLAIVALRLFTVPIMDFSSYAAGLTKISYKKFILASAVASIPDIWIFILGEQLYKRFFGKSIFIGVICLLIAASAYFSFSLYRHRRKKKKAQALAAQAASQSRKSKKA